MGRGSKQLRRGRRVRGSSSEGEELSASKTSPRNYAMTKSRIDSSVRGRDHDGLRATSSPRNEFDGKSLSFGEESNQYPDSSYGMENSRKRELMASLYKRREEDLKRREEEDREFELRRKEIDAFDDHNLKTYRTHPNDVDKTITSSKALTVDDLSTILGALLQPQERLTKAVVKQSGGMDLPKFSGSTEEWPAFHSAYTSTTEEYGYSNVNNFYRLLKSLCGRARESVQAMLVTPDNVPQIMDILEQQFGRPKDIIRNLIRKVTDSPSPNINKPSSIVDFSVAVQNLVATVKHLKKPKYLYDQTLMDTLTSKLPSYLRLEWGEKLYSHEDEFTLEDFAQWISHKSRAASAIMDESVDHNPRRNGRAEIYNDRTYEKPSDRFSWNKDRKPSQYNPLDFKPFKPNWDHDKKAERTYITRNGVECAFCHQSDHTLVRCPQFQNLPLPQKYDFLRSEKLCFCCLSYQHRANSCPNKKPCEINGCNAEHHHLLHPVERTEPSRSHVNVSSFHVDSTKVTKLGVLPVLINGTNGPVSTYVILDEGSTATLVDADFAKKNGLSGPIDPIILSTVSDGPKVDNTSMRVTFDIQGSFDGAKRHTIKGARTVTNLGLSVQSLDFLNLSKVYPYLEGLPIASYQLVQPHILLGQPDRLLGISRQVIHRKEDEPIAFKTWLGWTLSGKYGLKHDKSNQLEILQCSDQDLHKLVEGRFKMEDFGIKPEVDTLLSDDNRRAMDILKMTTRRIGEEFETGLLWKEDVVQFPNSYNYALSRLIRMEKKMDTNPAFKDEYEKKINEYLSKGFIQKLSRDEALQGGSKIFYLPHFGVFNPNKPGKMRFVFDAAAKVSGTSFNDLLLSGPDLTSPLLNVLLMFQQYEFAFGGDISDMFHRIKMRKEDLPSQRFLWRTDRTKPPDIYQLLVMTFGSKCSPCSAQYVKNLNATQMKDEFPLAFTAITNKHYVDDYWDSKPSEDEAIKTIQEVIQVHKRGGFSICKWMSNSLAVIGSISPELRAEGFRDVDGENSVLPTGRALGMYWDPQNDTFTYQLKFHKVEDEVWMGIRMPTKREVLKLAMSIYDPLGFVAHFCINIKVLMQDIWKSGTDWDETIPSEFHSRWGKWIRQLSELTSIKIPRCFSIGIPKASSIELHCFSDASGRAIAACAYIRAVYEDNVDVRILAAKTRVLPNCLMSMPRSELQGAVLLVRLASAIIKALEIKFDRVYFWTDSKTVLYWIRSNTREFKPFVAHRIGEILESTSPGDWKWIPTKENVADDATRVVDKVDLSSEGRWFTGPSFLKKDAKDWPTEQGIELVPDPRAKDEMKKTIHVHAVRVSEMMFPQIENFSRVNLGNRKSVLEKTICCFAWILRFIQNCRLTNKDASKLEMTESIQPGELAKAEPFVWKKSQMDAFAEEIHCIKSNIPLPRSSRIANLIPFLDGEGVLRMNSRLSNSNFLDYDAKHPIVLDGKGWVAKQVLLDLHSKFAHQGRSFIINESRKKFWIVGVTATARNIVRSCFHCRRINAKPIFPPMGLLPLERTTPSLLPFAICGMDFFGPILIQQRRAIVKRYGVIFTCMNSRAITLDLCENLTTESCILAIRRLIGRRCQPQVILSDNGTNLRGAYAELRKQLNDAKDKGLNQFLEQKGIEWKFIPPGSPHFGGAWERLVRSVKKCLHHILNESRPTEETLRTALQEAEHVVNCRPLTEVAVDPTNPVALTPMHLLMGAKFEPCGSPGYFEDYDKRMRSAWKQSQHMTELFWKRWLKEYLPTLARRDKWYKKTDGVKIGDIVVVADPTSSRNNWPLGRIVNVVHGPDKFVRVVDIKTESGILRRSVAKICPLNLASCP